MAAHLGRTQICRLCRNLRQHHLRKFIIFSKDEKTYNFTPSLSFIQKRSFQSGENESNQSKKSRLLEDLEDIRILVEKRLSQDGQTKNPQQQLQLLDELIKTRTKPNQSDMKLDTLASQIKSDEIYSLALKIWSLQSTIGEEAVNTSMPLFRIGAMLGDRNAKYTYGQLLFRGAGGLEADPIEASQMFQELSKEGHPQAQFTLAGMYYSGYGVEQNFETSYTLYQISAENGLKQSFNALGKMYLNGEGVTKDEQKALQYFMKGAEKDDAQACMSVAHCYNHGKGVEQNFDHAFIYHKKAADLGYTPGIFNIGTHYFAGKGVEMDMKKAVKCFHKAAEEGFVLAQVNLGNMYYQGLGVDRDVEKARHYYKSAAPNNRNARMLLEELEMEETKLKNEKE
ncbi:putative beta-lactamase HcpC [Clytia hemisphaerica]|uniref:Sel1 domain containing protein n=1 Tax=Clytia hemisphaerica TaxID=252671 RepID=A0A7M5WI48_9CNID